MAVLIPSPKDGDWTSLRSAIRKLASLKLGTDSKPTFAGLTLSDSFHLSYLTEGSVLFAGPSGLISQDNANLSWNNATDTLTVAGIIDSGLTASKGVYTDANKKLTSTAPATGILGHWSRAGTVLSPAVSGDDLTLTGVVKFSGDVGTIGSNSTSDLLTFGAAGLTVNGTIDCNSLKATGDGTIWSDGTTGVTPTSGAGTRMMWIPNKAAFRAGAAYQDWWDAGNVGNYSVAFGNMVKASGYYSFAAGYSCVAAGECSVALGRYAYTVDTGKIAIGNDCISRGGPAIGNGIDTGYKATGIGNAVNVYSGSTGIGSEIAAPLHYSAVYIGTALAAAQGGEGRSIFGFGLSATNPLTNATNYSMGFGNKTIYPTLWVGNLHDSLTGTVAVTQNSAAVVGTGTAFETELNVGDSLKVKEEIFTVSAITDNTHLTLDSNYLGANAASEVAYANSDLFKINNGDNVNVITVDKSGNTLIGDGGVTNYTQISATGLQRMYGVATVFKDINIGAATLSGPPGLQPGVVNFLDEAGGDTGIATSGLAVGEGFSGHIEMQHDYKEGSDIVFHVHWQGIAAPTGTDKVQFQLSYTFGITDATLDAVTTIVIEQDFDTQYEFKRTSFVAITGTDINMEDQLMFTLQRIAASADEYGGESLIATVGVHYEVDTLGSDTIDVKY